MPFLLGKDHDLIGLWVHAVSDGHAACGWLRYLGARPVAGAAGTRPPGEVRGTNYIRMIKIVRTYTAIAWSMWTRASLPHGISRVVTTEVDGNE
jgi:hypothetical protein